jgi:glutamate--cysteine ligase
MARSALNRAGQLELSGAPLENLHQTCAETGTST